jgi:Putative adhesin
VAICSALEPGCQFPASVHTQSRSDHAEHKARHNADPRAGEAEDGAEYNAAGDGEKLPHVILTADSTNGHKVRVTVRWQLATVQCVVSSATAKPRRKALVEKRIPILVSISMRVSFASIALAALIASPLVAQTDDGKTFRWSGPVAVDRFIRLYNMNGDVRVERGGSGTAVEVIAERRVERGDPKTVSFAVRMRNDGDVVVCALWGSDMQCTDDGARGNYSSGRWRNNESINVVIRVRVPDGVKTLAHSTNGDISIEGVTAEVDALTTNGNVNVSTSSGLVNASTTNGSVTATLGANSGADPMRFSTTNGSVTVFAPTELNANVELDTTNGDVVSDFPITVSGRMRSNQLRGTLGAGGRRIVVRSTNGDVSLKKKGL